MQKNVKSENDWTVSKSDIYLDLRILLDGCFRAIMKSENNCLKLDFDNGQKFVISVEQI